MEIALYSITETSIVVSLKWQKMPTTLTNKGYFTDSSFEKKNTRPFLENRLCNKTLFEETLNFA